MGVLNAIVECFFLLAARGGESVVKGLREGGAYAVLREVHVDIEDEGLREGVERVVQILMGGDENLGVDEEGGKDSNAGAGWKGGMVDTGEKDGDSDDDRIVEVF